MKLYHGSKSGIAGRIAPCSRPACDYGQGFYMGTDVLQPLTLICHYPEPTLYTLEFEPQGLRHQALDLDIDWALFIAYNRGKLHHLAGTTLYKRLESIERNSDVISGHIANDRMFVVLDRFFAGLITDVALVQCLSVLKLGRQYAAKTEKACRQIRIVEQQILDAVEREKLTAAAQENRIDAISRADDICRQHRREGMFFDELLTTLSGGA